MLKVTNYMDVENNDLLDDYDKAHTEYLDNTDVNGMDFNEQELRASDYAISKCNESYQERTSTKVINLLAKHNYSMFSFLANESQFISNELTKNEFTEVMKEFAYAMEREDEQMTNNELKTFKDELVERLD